MGSSTGRRAPLHLKQLEDMNTIQLNATLEIEDIVNSVEENKEIDFLGELLDAFDDANVEEAFRIYIDKQIARGNGCPVYVNPSKL